MSTTDINKFGLSRSISEDIKRTVRKNSKFGCILCRQAIYQYEHIDPVFVQATCHDPDNICLLCGTCHDKVTRGLISKITVKQKYREVRSSTKIKRPFSDFDLSSNQIAVRLGDSKFENCKSIITIDGSPVLSFEPSDEGIGFPYLSGIFTDNTGNETLRINKNEWLGSLNHWDTVTRGRRIIVRSKPRSISLQILLSPPNEITIERLEMVLGACGISIGKDLIIWRDHECKRFLIGVNGLISFGASDCIDLNSKTPPIPSFSGIRMVGGGGIELVGAGVILSKGAGSMTFPNIKVLHHKI